MTPGRKSPPPPPTPEDEAHLDTCVIKIDGRHVALHFYAPTRVVLRAHVYVLRGASGHWLAADIASLIVGKAVRRKRFRLSGLA